MDQNLKPGSVVVFVDENRQRHNALVTCAHGDEEGRVVQYRRNEQGEYLWENGQLIEESMGEPGEQWPCINLTHVSNDPRKNDSLGRQIERDRTSVPHFRESSAAGFCFYFPAEEEAFGRAMREALAREASRKAS